jgi:DNA repair protein RecO (recombination protein O)
MPINKTEAIVLIKRDFRETSLIVDFFTRDFGKISGLLKGIRTDPKKFASTLEPFSLNEIVFYEKRNSSLHLVSQADSRESFAAIRSNISKVGIASFMMELVSAVMAVEDRNEEVFDLTLTCLKELATTTNPDKIMTIFKIKMLTLSGFKPHFDSCISCGDRISGQSKFSMCLGGLLCPRCFQKDLSGRSIFRGTIASILHIERNDFRNNLNLGLNPDIKKELDVILNAFINFHLERELKSQKVINKLALAAQAEAI